MLFKNKINKEVNIRVDKLMYHILIEMTLLSIHRIKIRRGEDLSVCLGAECMKSIKNRTIDHKRLEKIYYTIIKPLEDKK